MKNRDYFRNKKVTVVGLARSGLSSANLLYDLGARVSVSEKTDNQLTRPNASKLKSKDIKIELGRHSESFIKGRELVVISPGVPQDSLAVAWASELDIPVISEIELGWMLCPGTVIAVTGSNGKTTVTTLIGRMLEAQAGKKVFVCGNIGTPFCEEVVKIKEGDYVSLEVSSFQLECIKSFKPKVSVMLNFTPNHLDRYSDLRQYLQAKKRIFMNQDASDYLVLNYDDPVLRKLAGEAKAGVVFFSKEKRLNPNESAVLGVGSILGIERKSILKVCSEFAGLQHRMEFVTEINKVKFINDSKATTADSTLWALENVNNPVILIAGGKDKGVDYSVILRLAKKKVRHLILLGQASGKIESVLGRALPVEKADSLQQAVGKAYTKARAGDCVLFSPMCSSFDMFSNYEERGRVFKDSVYGLPKEQGLYAG